jgi:hypothetical protein
MPIYGLLDLDHSGHIVSEYWIDARDGAQAVTKSRLISRSTGIRELWLGNHLTAVMRNVEVGEIGGGGPDVLDAPHPSSLASRGN